MSRAEQMDDFQKVADFHDHKAGLFRKHARQHTAAAEACEKTNPTLAESHRDMAKTCMEHSDGHEVERDRMLTKREKLNNGSNAAEMDNQSDAGEMMRSAASHLLDADGQIDFRKLISAEY